MVYLMSSAKGSVKKLMQRKAKVEVRNWCRQTFSSAQDHWAEIFGAGGAGGGQNAVVGRTNRP